MAIALVLVLVVVGSVLFHLLSPWWWTPIASNWDYIDNTIIITFWITGVVFAAVVLFMAYCVFRFRHRRGQPGRLRAGEQAARMVADRSSPAVGVAAMLAPGLFVWNQFVTVPEDATEVEVVGQQWQWSFRLPGKDGKLGTSDTALRHRRKSARRDPGRSRTARTTSWSKRPTCICRSASRSRCCCARSTCCMISTCREFRAKMDMIPGSVTYFWFTPTRTGTFEVLCAELCGRATPDARQRRGRQRSRLLRPGWRAADLRATCRRQQADRQTGHSETRRRLRDIRRSSRRRAARRRRSSDGRCHTWRIDAIPPAEVAGCRTLPSAQLVDEIRLLAGRQGHRHPVLACTAIAHRPGGAGAVLADAAAARLSRHLLLHRRRKPITSSSPCTA